MKLYKSFNIGKLYKNIIEIFNKDLNKIIDIDFVYTVQQKIKTSSSELNEVLSSDEDILNSSTIVFTGNGSIYYPIK